MGFEELALILIIVVVVFGSKRLPDLQDSLGRMLRGERPPARRLLLKQRPGWTGWDWALVVIAAILTITVLVLWFRGRHS
jgi:hypothetical protein